MLMRNVTVKIGITFLLLLVGSIALCQSKNARHYVRVKLSQVGESKVDTLEFKAKVKSVYKCPPCPEGAQCKPCIGDHVEVTDGNKEHDIRVFTDQLSLFKEGNSYRFLVRFRSKYHRTENVELARLVD